jgi:peptidoglycan-associated lipoprotein
MILSSPKPVGSGRQRAKALLRMNFLNFGRSTKLKSLHRIFVPIVLLAALTAVAGCKKKQPIPPAQEAPPPAAMPAPTAQLTATPTVISAGDQVQLTWRTTDATSVSLDGANVPTTGVKTVTPTATTTYRLEAHGDGGSADASATVTVNPPPAIVVPSNTMTAEQEFAANVQDIFYDYDTDAIRADAQATLSKDASYLVSHADVKVVIGGYCDERGSDEYNLALGQRRADSAKNALVTAGVAATRIRVISYGKEKPFCTESNEACWQQNRRAGFSMDR